MKLSSTDIVKIKYEKRIAFVFSSMIFTFGIISNLIAVFTFEKEFSITLLFIDFAIVILCILIPYFSNKKYNLDLEYGEKKVKTAKIQKKEKRIVYEAGSGTLFIGILGSIFPQLWGQKMREIPKTSLIINRCRYNIDKELFDELKEGEEIEMYYTKFSKVFLGIDKKN